MTQNDELLAWATAKLKTAQESKMYGAITFYLEAGTLTRIKKEETEKPVKTNGK